MALHETGVMARYGVELIGADARIRVAEDRALFGEAMGEIGLKDAAGGIAESWDEALRLVTKWGSPRSFGPSFTLGRQRRRDRLQPRGVRGHR